MNMVYIYLWLQQEDIPPSPGPTSVSKLSRGSRGLSFHISLLESLLGNLSQHCNYCVIPCALARHPKDTMYRIIEPFSELMDIELTSTVQYILEPLKCSHRADQEVYKKGAVQRFLRGQTGLQPASFLLTA